jgi:hypothetical protein
MKTNNNEFFVSDEPSPLFGSGLMATTERSKPRLIEVRLRLCPALPMSASICFRLGLHGKIGPASTGAYRLVLPTEGDSDRRAVIEKILQSVPHLEGWRKGSPAAGIRVLQRFESPAVRPARPDFRQPQRGCGYGYGRNAARHSAELTSPALI